MTTTKSAATKSPATEAAATARQIGIVRTPHAAGRMPALWHGGEFLLPAAALAHLAVEARGGRRVRRGSTTWQETGVDGEWSDVEPLWIGEMVWFRVSPEWRLSDASDTPVVSTDPERSATATERRAALAEFLPGQRSTSRPTLSVVVPERLPA